jgi:hypothetical protein
MKTMKRKNVMGSQAHGVPFFVRFSVLNYAVCTLFYLLWLRNSILESENKTASCRNKETFGLSSPGICRGAIRH